MNYKAASNKHEIKYALVYQWVKKYLKEGAVGLEHKKRGPKNKVSIDESTLSEIECLKLELEQEKAMREHAEFRLKLLKKKRNLHKKDALKSKA